MNNEIKEIIALISRMISNAEETAKEFCAVNDLTFTQVSYLETIHELGNPSITELASAMKISKPTATVAIDKLIMKGCVYKTHSDADRRSSHLHLTDVGNQINQRHDYAHEYITELIVQKLNKEEQATLITLLSKIL